MNREKTNSITHLVKIVAEEVFEEKFGELRQKLQQELTTEEAILRRLQPLRDRLFGQAQRKNNMSEVGLIWSKSDDEALRILFSDFLDAVAPGFGRTKTAIRCRIKDKLLGQG